MKPSRRSSLVSLGLTVLALAATAATAAPATAASGGDGADPAPPKLTPCDLGMPRLFQCGHVTVPMRRADPSLGTTKVAFAVRTRSDRSRPPLATIFAMDGGPGYASTDTEYASSLVAALGPLLRRRDLVLFDERGTGRSEAIDCPGLQGGLVQEYIAVGECANQLGPRYAGYTTAEAAEDLEVVRRALGLGRIFFYGDSYGTLFGQAYAVRHEASLRGLILDSSYPGTDDPYYRSIYPSSLQGLRITCRLAPSCSGDPVARLTRVARRFHTAHRSVDDLISFLLQAAYLAPRSYLSLDDGLRRFLAGDPRRLNRLLVPGRAGYGDPTGFSYGLEIAVECNDYPLLWDPQAPIDERIHQLSAATSRMPRDYYAPFTRREYILSSAARLTNCLAWPAPPAGGLEKPVPPGWRASTSFPTLILAGQVDNVTTVAEGREVEKRFPRSRFYVVPDRGHVSALYFPFRSPAVGVIRDFIASH
ncbi:MAG TPA: alpha/beta fold hydrolase [Solirubrobacterales bacterium]|nr:alpha/beta fold hydrolase [Solirubrobacterales bacterium]